jgi:hypothetical protein
MMWLRFWKPFTAMELGSPAEKCWIQNPRILWRWALAAGVVSVLVVMGVGAVIPVLAAAVEIARLFSARNATATSGRRAA